MDAEKELEFDPELFSQDPTVPPPSSSGETGPAAKPRPVTPAHTPAYLKAAVGDTTNQRQHLRFRAEGTTAAVHRKGLLSTLGLGRGNVVESAINLSEGGVLLLTRQRMKEESLVHVRIEIKSPPDVLESDGIIRWCASSRNRPDHFYVGIQFQGLQSAESVKLARMREWFNSPEYRMKEATRRSSRGSR